MAWESPRKACSSGAEVLRIGCGKIGVGVYWISFSKASSSDLNRVQDGVSSSAV